MECHKCPVAEAIKAGALRGVAYEDTPCASCIQGRVGAQGEPDVPQSKRGQTFVRLDPDTPAPVDVFDPAAADPDRVHSNDHSEVVRAVSYILKSILALDPVTREIVLHRIAYPAEALRVVGERIGLQKSTVHARLKKAREDWPALAWAIPMRAWANEPRNAQTKGTPNGTRRKTGRRPDPGRR